MHCPGLFITSPSAFYLYRRYVMYNVAEWSRCVWSRRRGDAGGGVLFVTRRAARACVHIAAVSWVLLIDSDRRVWACPYKHVFFLTDSLVVIDVEFPTYLSFESETWRASVIWETRGWHEWRILLRQREKICFRLQFAEWGQTFWSRRASPPALFQNYQWTSG